MSISNHEYWLKTTRNKIKKTTCGRLDEGRTAQVDIPDTVGDDGHVWHGGGVGTPSRAQPRHQRYLRKPNIF